LARPYCIRDRARARGLVIYHRCDQPLKRRGWKEGKLACGLQPPCLTPLPACCGERLAYKSTPPPEVPGAFYISNYTSILRKLKKQSITFRKEGLFSMSKKRPKSPVAPDSIPYIVIDEKPTRLAQDRQKSEAYQVTGQPQNALETAPESHTKRSKGTSRVDIGHAHQKPLKRLPIEEQLDDATEDFLLAVISGEDLWQGGPTGKKYKAPANLATRTKASELWLSRRRPQLQATAVRAEIKTDARAETLTNRELAQTIIRTLRSADVDQGLEANRLAPKKLAAPIGAAVGEGTTDISGVSPPCKIEEPLEPINPKHGHKVEALNSTGAFLRWFGPEHGHGSKYNIFNSANVCVGRTPRWENAVKILMNTKPSTETRHPDPFEMDKRGWEFAERRMEREARRQPRVIRRRGA